MVQIDGRGVPDAVRAKASDNVKIIGFVDDVRDYMARALVMVVPLRIGGGMRLKILNALAMAKAVVSTPIGCEGIAVEDGVNISVAEEGAEFATRVSELLSDAALREKMGDSGLAFVRESHTWPKLIADLESEYTRLIEGYR